MTNHSTSIKALLVNSTFPEVKSIIELPSSGSSRIYFRISFHDNKSILVAYNPDVNENIAWYAYTIHFINKGLPVPKIYTRDETYQYFLLEDLGSASLFQLLENGVNEDILALYKKTLDELIKFQVDGIEGLDLDVAYPAKAFDRRSVMWDLNYFKYYFVKPHDISFDEDKLENDFNKLAGDLLKADADYFMYRDFQARNVMIKDGSPWFIDFQGGRQGPLQYDLVSILYQAKANLSTEFRKLLYDHYLQRLNAILPDKTESFEKYFNYFVYFRLMQVLGAYGFRGLIQRKGHFLASIPYAIQNLIQLEETTQLTDNYPELKTVFQQIIQLSQYQKPAGSSDKLTITVNSFSFKKTSYPIDESENGGGFVFDCRFLPNPGRIPELRDFNGTQSQIIEYLEKRDEVEKFIERVITMVEPSVENYLERGFSNLQINFGCTGGKHRSVYSTEFLSNFLTEKYGDKIHLIKNHLQKNDW